MRAITAIVASAALLLAVAPAAIARYVDPAKKYSIEFPAGWSKPVLDGDTTQSNAPGGAEVAFCRTNSVRMPTLDATTQAQLNAEFAKPLDAATWAGVMKLDQSKLTKIMERDAKLVDGHVVQYITVRLSPDVLGKDLILRYATHVLVGRMVNALCFAPPKSYDGMKAVLDRTVKSLKPL